MTTSSKGEAGSRDESNHPCGDDVGGLVIDLGSQDIRVGYAGEDCPKQLWPACVGVPTDGPSSPLVCPVSFLVGTPHMQVRPCFLPPSQRLLLDYGGGLPPSLRMNEVATRGSQTPQLDEEAFERLVGVCLGKEVGLGVSLKQQPVLLTEPTRHNRKLRAKMARLMFERFDVEATYVAKRAVLTAFSLGRASACVTELGASSLVVTPVHEGYSLQRQLLEYPVAGDMIDCQVAATLASTKKYNVQPVFAVKKLLKTGGRAISRVEAVDLSTFDPSLIDYSTHDVVRSIKELTCRVAEGPRFLHDPPSLVPGTTRCELPDGTFINDVSSFSLKAPEILFDPTCLTPFGEPTPTATGLKHFAGLHRAVAQAVTTCDVDVRRDLLAALILSGGSSLLPGLPERLTKMLQEDETLLGGGTKFKVVAPGGSVERRFAAWIGGSILASLGTFQQMWMSRAEYEEHGAVLLERKCLL